MRLRRVPIVSMIGIGMTVVVSIALTISGHHVPPAGTFNDTFSDVQGIVKEVRFRPPHVWIMLEVRSEGGELQLWPLEAASPTALQQIGVKADYLKAGDAVKARCRRLRVVEKGKDNDCILGFLKTKTGVAKDLSGNNLPIPADF